MLAPGARGTWSCISGAYETKTGRELWRVATEQLISGANPITCKAFAMTPPSCAVRGLSRQYSGETRLLWFQNLHRYTLYGALFILVCLWWEGLAAFFRDGRLGIGVGTVVMLVNASLLTGYTFGCHSWRHLILPLSGLNGCGYGFQYLVACRNGRLTRFHVGLFRESCG